MLARKQGNKETRKQQCSHVSLLSCSHGQEGFTLAEMLVVIFIFTVITGGVVANFRVGERSTELRLGAERIASALRNMQNMAQTGEQVEMCDNQLCGNDGPAICLNLEDCKPQVPAGGYGVHLFLSNSLVFFADLNGNRVYDDPEEKLSNVSVDLTKAVVISGLNIDLNDNLSVINIVFVPPAPEVYLNACDHNAPPSGVACPTSARITVQHMRTEQSSTIVVQRLSGRIEVE